jgi:hypothetical protein
VREALVEHEVLLPVRQRLGDRFADVETGGIELVGAPLS